MSIFIKGMELPTDPLYPIHVTIYADGTVITGHGVGEFAKEAVPVPTPHGRLIDADEMASDEADAYLSAQITIATTGNKDDEQEALMTINDMVHKKLQMLLKDAPTVIEAEEG